MNLTYSGNYQNLSAKKEAAKAKIKELRIKEFNAGYELILENFEKLGLAAMEEVANPNLENHELILFDRIAKMNFVDDIFGYRKKNNEFINIHYLVGLDFIKGMKAAANELLAGQDDLKEDVSDKKELLDKTQQLTTIVQETHEDLKEDVSDKKELLDKAQYLTKIVQETHDNLKEDASDKKELLEESQQSNTIHQEIRDDIKESESDKKELSEESHQSNSIHQESHDDKKDGRSYKNLTSKRYYQNQNAYDGQTDFIKKLRELAEKVKYEALLGLAFELKISPEDLLRILSGNQGIDPGLGKRIDYLWQIKFGTVHYPGPLPSIPESITFYYMDMLYGDKDPYLDPVYWDILPYYVDEKEYDDALTRARNKINKVLDETFENLHVVPTSHISIGRLFDDDIPETRIFEFNIVDRQSRMPRYALKYFKGEVQLMYGNLPIDKIVPILEEEGVWQ